LKDNTLMSNRPRHNMIRCLCAPYRRELVLASRLLISNRERKTKRSPTGTRR
jgi:hypothetical protein